MRFADVRSALQTGYTFLDTAAAYRWTYHEDEVGDAVAEEVLDGAVYEGQELRRRKKLFVQSKIDPLHFQSDERPVHHTGDPNRVFNAILESLLRLR